jgi:hypothetical protein
MEMSQLLSLLAILHKQKCHFFVQKQRTGRQNKSCFGDEYKWKGENIRNKGSEGEYGRNILYTCMSTEK